MRTIVSAVGSRMVAHVRGTILLPQIPHLSREERGRTQTQFGVGGKKKKGNSSQPRTRMSRLSIHVLIWELT